MKNILLVTLVVCSLLCGCKSQQGSAYKTLGTIAITVNAAKHAFYDYRATHPVPAEVEAKAKTTYETYQKSMAIAETVEKQFVANGDNTVWLNALGAVTASGNQFLDLVRVFVPAGKL